MIRVIFGYMSMVHKQSSNRWIGDTLIQSDITKEKS